MKFSHFPPTVCSPDFFVQGSRSVGARDMWAGTGAYPYDRIRDAWFTFRPRPARLQKADVEQHLIRRQGVVCVRWPLVSGVLLVHQLAFS